MTTIVQGEILGPDLLVILAIVFLLFGGTQLPKLARSIGTARREFEQGLAAGESEPPRPPQSDSASAPATPNVMSKADVEKMLDTGNAPSD
jgi:sec-independent protein translocase protein TatA